MDKKIVLTLIERLASLWFSMFTCLYVFIRGRHLFLVRMSCLVQCWCRRFSHSSPSWILRPSFICHWEWWPHPQGITFKDVNYWMISHACYIDRYHMHVIPSDIPLQYVGRVVRRVFHHYIASNHHAKCQASWDRWVMSCQITWPSIHCSIVIKSSKSTVTI